MHVLTSAFNASKILFAGTSGLSHLKSRVQVFQFNARPTNGAIVQGNVGVGTASPINSLDIYGAVAIGTGYAGVNTAPMNGVIVQGNVGIGTATPQVALDIAGSYPILRLTNSSTTQYTGAAIQLIGPSSLGTQGGTLISEQDDNSGATQGGFVIDHLSASGAFQASVLFANYNANTFTIYTNNTSAVVLDSSQRALVGYTGSQSSCCQLQVNGAIGATSTAITSLSDRRLKENIEPLTGALGVVNDLKPVTYNFLPNDTHHFPNGTQIGFIAQDVEAAVRSQPYAAALVDAPEKKGDYYALRESNMIPLLVRAIQEQQDEIAILKQKIEQLNGSETEEGR